MSRLDAMVAREWTDRDGNTKTNWTRIGVAFPAKSGSGYTISFEALPIPTIGRDGKLECRVMLREPLPARDGDRAAPQQRAPQRPAASGYSDDIDDSIPF